MVVPSKEFLADLSRILRRHGPEPWLELADAIADPVAREKTLRLLNELAAIAGGKHEPATRAKRKERRSDYDRAIELIEHLRGREPAKADRLREFLEDYGARRILGTRRDVVAFLETLGVTPPQKQARDKLVRLVVTTLSSLPIQQFDESLAKARSVGKSSYSELFDAITRPRRALS